MGNFTRKVPAQENFAYFRGQILGKRSILPMYFQDGALEHKLHFNEEKKIIKLTIESTTAA